MGAKLTDPVIQQSVAYLDRNLKISLTDVLAKCYGEGFVKAAEALDATPHVTRDDSELLKKDVERLVKPIQDYNQALGDKIYDIVQDGFASGKDDLQVAADLRSRIPEILNNEPITIQRPGKRPVSYTAEGYADMVAGIIPYQVRGNGYVRGLEESGADGWEWVATDDERMCEVCGDLNGQVFDFDKQFDIAHPGCRCRPIAFFKPKTKEEEAESERIKEKAKEEPWNAEEDETPGPKTQDSASFKKVPIDAKFDERLPDDLKKVLDQSYAQKSALSNEEQDAINAYKHTNYQEVNQYLRDPSKYLSEASKENIEQLDNAFEKVSLPDDITVYSGLRKVPNDIDFTPGSEFLVPEYTSSSVLPQSANQFAQSGYMMEIELPKDSKALYVGSAYGTNEKEVIINHGSTYQVIEGPKEKIIHSEFGDDKVNVVKIRLVSKDIVEPQQSAVEVADQLVEPIYPKKYAYPGSTIERPRLEHKAIDIENSPTINKEIQNGHGGIIGNLMQEGDPILRNLSKEIGFNDLPTVVNESEMDKIVAEGHKELWRGLNQPKRGEYTDQFRYGEYFAGKGIFGNGTYTATGDNGKMFATLYSPGEHGAVMRMAIDKDANIITYTDLKKMLDEELKKQNLEEIKDILSDPGRFATIRGYDAIDIDGKGQLIVLNRKSLYVQATDYYSKDREGWYK